MLLKKIRATFCGSYKNQILASFIVNAIAFAHGIALGWMSPTLLVLSTDNSPFQNPITITEASWLGSLISIGALIGNTIFGILIDLIGRKKSLLIAGVPHMFFWLLIYFGKHVQHLYGARILAGITGGGIFIIIPIFVAEISDNNIRGTLASLFILLLNSGLVVGYILTSYLSYSLVPLITIGLPVLYIIMVTCLPDTPQYLLKNGNEIQAERSLKFYLNYNGNSKDDFVEFNLIFTKMKNSFLGLDKKNIRTKDFCTRGAIKAFIIGFFLMIINQFSGAFAILNYSTKVFNSSGSVIDPNLCTIIIGVIQILGSYMSTIFVDRYGRKILLIISSTCMSLGLFTCGINSYLMENTTISGFTWIPILSISFVIFCGAFGVNSIVFLVLIEILPTKIRAIGSMICLFFLSLFAFTALKIFPILLDSLKLYGVMWGCGSVCIFGSIFITLFVPETKGKDLIQDE